MAALFESGRVVDLILALLVFEASLLCIAALVWRGRFPLAGLLLNIAAGGCLLLALRAVLVGAEWTVTGAWLAAAFVAHAGDLIQRFRGDASLADGSASDQAKH